MQLEFEHAYLKFVVQHITHYATGTPKKNWRRVLKSNDDEDDDVQGVDYDNNAGID